MSFQDELKSKIKSEEELKKKDIEKAKNKADWDYRAVKDWLLFEAEHILNPTGKRQYKPCILIPRNSLAKHQNISRSKAK